VDTEQRDDVSRRVGNFSHAAHTLFNTVIGYTDILRRDDPSLDLAAEERREYAEIAYQACSRLVDVWAVTSEYLLFKYQPVELTPEAVRLDDLIARVQGFMESRGADIQVTLAEDLPQVRGDLRWLCNAILGCLADLCSQTRPYREKHAYILSAQGTDDGLVLIRIRAESRGEHVYGPGGIGTDMARLVVEQLGGRLTFDGGGREATIDLVVLPWETGAPE